MNVTTSGPVPTKQVFLYQISQLEPGTKIRFLGCVWKYDVTRGVLRLEHNYAEAGPRPSASSRNTVDVDVNLLVESLTHAEVEVGAWINVLGYVRHREVSDVVSGSTTKARDRSTSRRVSSSPTNHVEAVMIIPAGAVRVGEYERILRDVQEAARRVSLPGK